MQLHNLHFRNIIYAAIKYSSSMKKKTVNKLNEFDYQVNWSTIAGDSGELAFNLFNLDTACV